MSLRQTRHTIVVVVGLCMLTGLAYLRAGQAAFVWDDVPVILQNARVTQPQPLWSYWTEPELIAGLDLRGFRPLTFASFAWNYQMAGPSRTVFHVTSVGIHMLAVLGVWRLASIALGWNSKQKGHAILAALAAAIFAVHPALSQAVLFLTARSTLIAAAGILWAAVFYHSAVLRIAHRKAGGWPCFIGALLCWSIGLSGKESAIAGAILFVGIEWWSVVRHSPSQLWKAALGRLLIPAFLGCVYLYWVFAVVQAQSTTPPARTMIQNIMGQLGAAWEYTVLLAWPTSLSVDHAAESLALSWSGTTTAGLLVVLALGSLAWWFRTRIPACTFGMVGALVCIGPEAYAVPLKIVVNEHRLYLPAALLAISAIALLGALGSGESRPRIRATALVAVLGLCLIATNRRAAVWASPERLWEDAWEKYPSSCRAPAHLGKLAYEASPPQLAKAISFLESATTCNPERLEPRVLLVQALSQDAQHGKAQVLSKALLDEFPTESVVHSVHGTAMARAGDLEAARSAWTRALELNPRNSAARENLERLK